MSGSAGYRSYLTVASLRVPESRVVADLLLNGQGVGSAWRDAVAVENVLQIRSKNSASGSAIFFGADLIP